MGKRNGFMKKKKPEYEEWCPRCDKITKWDMSEPYQRGFIDYTCKTCGLRAGGYDDFWYEPDEEEKETLRNRYKK